MPYTDLEKRRETKRKSAAKHREKENAKRLAAYHAQTPDERAAYLERQKRSRAKKPDKYSAIVQKYQSKNKDKLSEYRKVVYRSGGKEKMRGYQKLNPQIFRIAAIRSKCKNLGIEFTLNSDWYKRTYTGFCSLTGMAFRVVDRNTTGHHPFASSVDRIDQTKGYTPDNCRWVLMAVNAFRGSGTDDEMFEIARALLNHANKS